jgi:hypothetical protein
MTAPMSLPERLAVHKWLSERLSALRSEELLPEASAKLTIGERAPVKFGGELVAWVSVPKPSVSARVSDERKLLAWAREHAPGHVGTVREVIVSDALADYLAEHAPQFLSQAERCDPQWVDDVLAGMKNRGCYIDANGEKHDDLPGITVSEGKSFPRVDLKDCAAEVIGEAWRKGDITMPSLLALPAPDREVAPVAEPEPGPSQAAAADFYFDAENRFRSPELAAMHAVTEQGGFSTPAREARRMLADAFRRGDPEGVAEARDWLTSRGLSLNGDDEPGAV